MPTSTLERVSDHVWRFTPDERTDRPALGAVHGSRGTVLVDAGASPAHLNAFLAALDGASIPRPLACLLTHWHWDHSFGASALSAPVVAHPATAEALRVQASYDWSNAALDARVACGAEIPFVAQMLRLELPDRAGFAIVTPHVIVDTQLTIDLGTVTCTMRHVGGDHAEDSCVIHVPEDRLLFLGDALYERLYAPVEHLTATRLLPLVDRIAAFDASLAIEGHEAAVHDGPSLAARLQKLRTCARRFQSLGEAALLAAADDEERDITRYLLAGGITAE